MKILLIQPPIQDFYQTATRTQPIGFASLASFLKKHGYDGEILDCQTQRKNSVPIHLNFLTLKIFIPSMTEVLSKSILVLTISEWIGKREERSDLSPLNWASAS